MARDDQHSTLEVKTKPVRQAAPAIGRAFRKTLGQLATASGAMDPALISAWDRIVGPELAKFCRPVRIVSERNVQTLVLTAFNGSAAMRVTYAQKEILTRASIFLKMPRLKKLRIDQSGAAAPAEGGARKSRRRGGAWASQMITGAEMTASAAPDPDPPARPAESLDEALLRLKRSLDDSMIR